MKRGTTPAWRYCSTDEVLRSVRRVRRRFGRLLLIPDLALHELDRVAGGIADVEGTPPERPGDLALDFDPIRAEPVRETSKCTLVDTERRVPGAGRAVRRNETARNAARLGIEDQKQPAVGQAEGQRVLVRPFYLA